ncbi:formylglycine-generating enzyme family protein [Glycocaulis albus]
MVWIPPGTVQLGSEDFFPEERPVRNARVDGFWIGTHEVTNLEFAAFVAATGYVTLAEREGVDAGGGGVFGPGVQVRDWSDIRTWWRFDPGASWRHPQGRASTIEGRDTFPVVQIAYEDALAYARWRGHDLPGEAEWEMAARGGLTGAPYVWGANVRPDGTYMANHWQGVFPVQDNGADGHAGLAPVGCFAPNGYGLHDMAGNVWEWTRDEWEQPGFRVIKGGSFLCSDSYCHRYRPAARQPGDERFSTEHLGFRTIWRGPAPD